MNETVNDAAIELNERNNGKFLIRTSCESNPPVKIKKFNLIFLSSWVRARSQLATRSPYASYLDGNKMEPLLVC